MKIKTLVTSGAVIALGPWSYGQGLLDDVIDDVQRRIPAQTVPAPPTPPVPTRVPREPRRMVPNLPDAAATRERSRQALEEQAERQRVLAEQARRNAEQRARPDIRENENRSNRARTTMESLLGAPANASREIRRQTADQAREVNEFVERLRGNPGQPVPVERRRGEPPARIDFDTRTQIELESRRDHHDDHRKRWARNENEIFFGPVHHGHRHYNRAIRFRDRSRVPAVLLAAVDLNYLHFNQIDRNSQFQGQYELAYNVDRSSQISRDDILFRQGTTDFADQQSANLVYNLAYAMNDPSLRNERFVIEGHASAEGAYESNLDLSQRRAERIAREIVSRGVYASRLVPIGYGESEALYRADAPESVRRLDRRVVVYRLIE
ncbi:MAG: OmpA family protein [Verrucomicrobiales bacterium]|nr:OmpA family protein [Verrucomicrobiales bacterium]